MTELELELLENVARERESTGEVLRCLREIDKQDLYKVRGCSSLYLYCLDKLGYSEFEAHLRIQATRLAEAVPEIFRYLNEGKVSLTVAALVQGAAKRENLTPEQARDLFRECKCTSKRQAERKIAERFPRAARPEKAKPINADQVEITFTVSREKFEQIESLMDRRAHTNFERSYEVLFTGLVGEALKKYESEREAEQQAEPKEVQEGADESAQEGEQGASQDDRGEEKAEGKPAQDTPPHCPDKAPSPRSRHIPNHIRRAVWRRDKSCCQYRDPETGEKCGESHGVQLDHIILYSEGGAHTEENLRLLCGAHNRLRNCS